MRKIHLNGNIMVEGIENVRRVACEYYTNKALDASFRKHFCGIYDVDTEEIGAIIGDDIPFCSALALSEDMITSQNILSVLPDGWKEEFCKSERIWEDEIHEGIIASFDRILIMALCVAPEGYILGFCPENRKRVHIYGDMTKSGGFVIVTEDGKETLSPLECHIHVLSGSSYKALGLNMNLHSKKEPREDDSSFVLMQPCR